MLVSKNWLTEGNLMEQTYLILFALVGALGWNKPSPLNCVVSLFLCFIPDGFQIFLNSFVVDLLQVFLEQPGFLFPWRFHSRAFFELFLLSSECIQYPVHFHWVQGVYLCFDACLVCPVHPVCVILCLAIWFWRCFWGICWRMFIIFVVFLM